MRYIVHDSSTIRCMIINTLNKLGLDRSSRSSGSKRSDRSGTLDPCNCVPRGCAWTAKKCTTRSSVRRARRRRLPISPGGFRCPSVVSDLGPLRSPIGKLSTPIAKCCPHSARVDGARFAAARWAWRSLAWPAGCGGGTLERTPIRAAAASDRDPRSLIPDRRCVPDP